MAKKFRFLFTNDDGVHAPGISALARGLSDLGEVTIAAPVREMSGLSHSFTIFEPLFVDELSPQSGVGSSRIFGVKGTPADAVKFAVTRLFKEKPDRAWFRKFSRER